MPGEGGAVLDHRGAVHLGFLNSTWSTEDAAGGHRGHGGRRQRPQRARRTPEDAEGIEDVAGGRRGHGGA